MKHRVHKSDLSMPNKKLPNKKSLEITILEAITDWKIYSKNELNTRMKNKYSEELTYKEMNRQTYKKEPLLFDRIDRAKTSLKKKGFIHAPMIGTVQITKKGIEHLSAHKKKRTNQKDSKKTKKEDKKNNVEQINVKKTMSNFIQNSNLVNSIFKNLQNNRICLEVELGNTITIELYTKKSN